MRSALGIAFVAMALALPARGVDSPAPSADPMAALDQMLSAFVGDMDEAQLRSTVESVGGLKFRKPVSVDFLDRKSLERYLREVADDEYPPSRAHADQRLLVGLGLLDADVDLRALRIRLLEENVAGFYDDRPGRKRLYAVSSNRRFTPSNQIILAHELRHALQDQHVDVRGPVAESIGDFDDRRLAWVSTLEGDAMVVMKRFIESRVAGALPGIEGFFGAGGGGLDTIPVPEVPGAPAVLRDQMVLPYFVGLRFVTERIARGGWSAVVETWKRPPSSTEQILHPEKYAAAEPPMVVKIGFAPAGAKLVTEGVLGELLMRSLLGGGAPAEAGAAGWGGDTYSVWEKDGRWLLVHLSRWESEKEAAEFEETLVTRRLEVCCGDAHSLGSFRLFERPGWRAALRREGTTVTLVTTDDAGLLVDAVRGLT